MQCSVTSGLRWESFWGHWAMPIPWGTCSVPHHLFLALILPCLTQLCCSLRSCPCHRERNCWLCRCLGAASYTPNLPSTAYIELAPGAPDPSCPEELHTGLSAAAAASPELATEAALLAALPLSTPCSSCPLHSCSSCSADPFCDVFMQAGELLSACI